MEPETRPAKVVLSSIVQLVLCDGNQMLLAKARPIDEMPFVNLQTSIEAGVAESPAR